MESFYNSLYGNLKFVILFFMQTLFSHLGSPFQNGLEKSNVLTVSSFF